MSKATMLMILGALVVIAPFSGVPGFVLEFALPAIGLAVLALGYGLRPRRAGGQEGIDNSVNAS